jgi:hypothetical protein
VPGVCVPLAHSTGIFVEEQKERWETSGQSVSGQNLKQVPFDTGVKFHVKTVSQGEINRMRLLSS